MLFRNASSHNVTVLYRVIQKEWTDFMTHCFSSQASSWNESVTIWKRSFLSFEWLSQGRCSCVVPRQRSIVCLPSEWRVLSKRRSAFSSSRKQIRLSRCSVLFEGDSTLIRPLLRTFDGGFDSFKRVGVCVKEKVQDDHEFWRNKWWESVLRLREAHGSPQTELAMSLRSLNPLSGMC